MRDDYSHPGKPQKGAQSAKKGGGPREGQNLYCKYHKSREKGNENTGRALKERTGKSEGAGLKKGEGAGLKKDEGAGLKRDEGAGLKKDEGAGLRTRERD